MLHLKPGKKGVKQLLAQYGDRLVCVRYRYDTQRKKWCKTVELIIVEREWNRHHRALLQTRLWEYALALPRWSSETR